MPRLPLRSDQPGRRPRLLRRHRSGGLLVPTMAARPGEPLAAKPGSGPILSFAGRVEQATSPASSYCSVEGREETARARAGSTGPTTGVRAGSARWARGSSTADGGARQPARRRSVRRHHRRGSVAGLRLARTGRPGLPQRRPRRDLAEHLFPHRTRPGSTSGPSYLIDETGERRRQHLGVRASTRPIPTTSSSPTG